MLRRTIKWRLLARLGNVLLGLGLSPALAGEPQELRVWVINGHAERPYFAQLAEAFSQRHAARGIELRIEAIPGYNDAIEVAWLSGDLPDIIMIDGPHMARYVWHGILQPIDELISAETVAQLLPGVVRQGRYPPDRRIYMLSAGDSSIALWANRRHLERAGIEIPRALGDAWDYDEFTRVLAALKRLDGVRWPLDFKLGYTGEWRAYGYYPLIRSAGGKIIDERAWRAAGALNGTASASAVAKLRAWIDSGYVVPASAGDNRFFGDRSASLSWAGNWVYRSYTEALGEDLVVIPAPRLGAKALATNGSWGWAVPAQTQPGEAHRLFLEFVLSKEQVARWSQITGYIPARADAIDETPVFGPDGLMRIFLEQARKAYVVRPVHPAYTVISREFGKAMADIFAGADIESALDRACDEIDWDIEDNLGYPPFGQ